MVMFHSYVSLPEGNNNHQYNQNNQNNQNNHDNDNDNDNDNFFTIIMYYTDSVIMLPYNNTINTILL